MVMSPSFCSITKPSCIAKANGGARPALVLRIGKALARNGELALLLHDGRGFGRENRIAVIADQLAGIGGAVRATAQISQGLRTRWHWLEIERVLAPAESYHAFCAI